MYITLAISDISAMFAGRAPALKTLLVNSPACPCPLPALTQLTHLEMQSLFQIFGIPVSLSASCAFPRQRLLWHSTSCYASRDVAQSHFPASNTFCINASIIAIHGSPSLPARRRVWAPVLSSSAPSPPPPPRTRRARCSPPFSPSRRPLPRAAPSPLPLREGRSR